MTRISRPIFVMAFAAAMIFGTALLVSSVLNRAEPPIEPEISAPTPDLNLNDG